MNIDTMAFTIFHICQFYVFFEKQCRGKIMCQFWRNTSEGNEYENLKITLVINKKDMDKIKIDEKGMIYFSNINKTNRPVAIKIPCK